MDPNANLIEMLDLADTIIREYDDPEGCPSDDDANRLAELVKAMHGWIIQGGFPPSLWKIGLEKNKEG